MMGKSKALFNAVMSGNATIILQMAETNPDVFFRSAFGPIESNGRSFNPETTPLEILFWAGEPILQTLWKNNPALTLQLQRHKECFLLKGGLLTKTENSSLTKEISYDFQPVINSLKKCRDEFDRKKVKKCNQNLLEYNEALRYMPVWVSQYICNTNADNAGEIHHYLIGDHNRKKPQIGTIFWSDLFEKPKDRNPEYAGIGWSISSSWKDYPERNPMIYGKYDDRASYCYRSTTSAFEGLNTLYQAAQKQFLMVSTPTQVESKSVAPPTRKRNFQSAVGLFSITDSSAAKKQSIAASLPPEQKSPPLDEYLCPITQELMKDPVILTDDGHTYERAAIIDWLKKKPISPLTNDPIDISQGMDKVLVPNRLIKGLIEKYERENQQQSSLRSSVR